jgi:predicted aspartyl protease
MTAARSTARAVQFMVDTGASVISMSAADADAHGHRLQIGQPCG